MTEERTTTEDRFERDLRATVGQAMDLEAPSVLRERVERVLASQPQPARRARLWVGAAAAVGLVAVVVITGLVVLPPSRVVVSTPLGSASPGPSASGSGPSASPALVEALGMPVSYLPEGVARRAAFGSLLQDVSGTTPSGPYAYVVGDASQGVRVVDIGDGSLRTVPGTAPGGAERIASLRSDGTWLAVEYADDNGCPGGTLHWRIMVARIGADGMPLASASGQSPFGTVADGSASQPFTVPGHRAAGCRKPLVPAVALGDGRLAWATQTSPGIGPSAVHVRALEGMGGVQLFAAGDGVVGLAVSSSAVAWVETPNGLANGDVPAWAVMEAPLTAAAASPVDIGDAPGDRHANPPTVVLDGTALVVGRDLLAATDGTVVRIDRGALTVVDPGAAYRSCTPAGAAEGRVVLTCSAPDRTGQTGAPSFSWLATWTPADGLRAVGLGTELATVQTVWTRPDAVVWMALDPAYSDASLVFRATPLDKFFASGSPTPLATPTPAPSTVPTAPPWVGQVGLPFVTVPAGVVRSAIAGSPPAAVAGAPAAGPYVYLASGEQRVPAVVDVGGGSVRIGSEAVVGAHERVARLLSDEGWLVLELVSSADPCVDASPMTWRIAAAPIGPDGMPGRFTDVAKGAVKTAFQSAVVLGMNCSKELPPPIALSGDSLAWAEQTSASPDTGSTVSIQPLNALDVAPDVLQTQTYVTQLVLSSDLIAWVEEGNGLSNGGKPAWRVFEQARADLVIRQPVDVGEAAGRDHAEPPLLVADGTVLYASLDGYAGVSGTTVRIENGVRQVVDSGRPNQTCGVTGAEGGVVLFSCQGSTSSTSFGFNAVWTSGAGLRAIAVDQTIPDSLEGELRPGWLIVSDIVESGGQSYTAIPLSALAATAP